jgi:hypothetical protein
VNPVRKLSSHACGRNSQFCPSRREKQRTPAINTFVGLLVTNAALATFAAMNWLIVHALGTVIPVARVKYPKNAVPLSTIGSFPTRTPKRNQKQ